MSRRIREHLSFANIVAVLCLFAVLGGGAYAATGGGGGSGPLSACVGKGSVLILARSGKPCPRRQRRLTWARQGLAGPTGPAGAPGATGAVGPSHAYSTTVTQAPLPSSPGEATVATLRLPAGSYELDAKLYMEATPKGAGAYGWLAGCRLKVNGVEDFSKASGVLPAGGYLQDAPMSLRVLDTLSGDGSATLSCFKESTEEAVEAKSVVLSAIRVGAID
ncbi:MAG TPA: hypothetical protein VN618_06535 [Solirubrobacteraceae bacterium]|nr:hypothetical protein [Solirubrobacteraceae bacterium]